MNGDIDSKNKDNFNKKNTKKDVQHFNAIISKLSSSPIISTQTPWYKKKTNIIAMSSALGVGVLATAIAVPTALLTSVSSSTTPDIIPEQILAKVEQFNLKPTTEKIVDFNKMITLEFQTEVYNFWMQDSRIIVANPSLIVNSPFYKYALNNLDQTTILASEPIMRETLIQFMTYKSIPPTSGTGNEFTPSIKNMFKIFTLGDTDINYLNASKLISNTNNIATVASYTMASLFFLNNISNLQLNINRDNTLSISITNTDAVSNFLYYSINNNNNPINQSYKYNQTYILNNAYTNKLLSTLITNFLIAN